MQVNRHLSGRVVGADEVGDVVVGRRSHRHCDGSRRDGDGALTLNHDGRDGGAGGDGSDWGLTRFRPLPSSLNDALVVRLHHLELALVLSDPVFSTQTTTANDGRQTGDHDDPGDLLKLHGNLLRDLETCKSRNHSHSTYLVLIWFSPIRRRLFILLIGENQSYFF